MDKLIINYYNEQKADKVFDVVREKVGPSFHESIFPRKRTADLTWDALDAKITNVAASVQNYGTKARRFKRDSFTAVKGNINPIEIAYELDEKLMLNIMNPNYKNPVLDQIFEDTLNAYNAIRARLDWIAMSQLSSGTVEYSATNNADGISGVFVDYDLESWQTADAAATWATVGSSTPLTDIRNQLETLEGKGIYPDVIRMTKTIFNYMVASNEVLTTLGFTVTKSGHQSQYISVNEMNVFFAQKDMPRIEIVRDDVSFLSADGSFSNTRSGWAEGIVQFGFNQEGRSNYVEPLEYSQRALTPAIVTLKNGVAIQNYSELDPPNIITKGKSIQYPVWNKSGSVLLLDATP